MPIAWIYGCAVNLRNWMFDIGVLPTRTFDVPVVGVGNLTVGGTGKTPHTEYLVRMMLDEGLRVATLSRGYKRRTRGYREATPQSTVQEIGDEPLQMATAFPQITVAVDENRARGVERLLSGSKKTDIVLLDDAYQHRYVKPLVNILLVDYNRPPYADRLLPAGRLREHFRGKRRADIVVVTKCPQRMSPIDFRVVEQELGLMPFQKLFFSTMQYSDLQPLFGSERAVLPLKNLRSYDSIMLLTGIAQPEQMRHDLMRYCQRVTPLRFADHHAFSAADADTINRSFRHLPADEKIIITTAKDAVRLRAIEGLLSDTVRNALYVLPVHVKFIREEERTFRRIIMDSIKKNIEP